MPLPAAVIGGISVGGKIVNIASKLFGSKPREGEEECLPCGGIAQANALFDAFQIDTNFLNTVSNGIRSALAREGASLPRGCQGLETASKVALAAEFMAKGSNNCKANGSSEKEVKKVFPLWVQEANRIIQKGGRVKTGDVLNGNAPNVERVGGPISPEDNAGSVFGSVSRIKQPITGGIAGGVNFGTSTPPIAPSQNEALLGTAQMSNQNMLLIGAALVAAFFLLK